MAAPGDFGFGRVLGEGAFANVVHARRKSDGEDVALKVMLKAHVEREGKTRLVLAEAKALRTCADCPHVVRLHATFQTADYLFFCLEFCAGDLLHVINDAKNYRVHRPAGGLQPFAAAFYAGEIVLGLAFLYDRSLAHRDLKPENVLLDARGRARLADFGAVLVVEEPDAHDLGERHGSFEGTAEYVSPEVLQGEATTCACDLWALGCIVYVRRSL
jgi:serine/threonine protein kinase